MESRFQIKICCFVIRLCTFAHSYLTTHFLNLNDTRFIAERSPHSHIQRFFFFFFIGMMLMNVFVSPYFCQHCWIHVHFYCFMFCFKFFNPFLDINVKNLYVLFLRACKTNTKCCNEFEKTQRYNLGVA